MGAFDGGDDALHPGEGEEGVDGLLVSNHIVLNSAQIPEEGVLRAGGGVVQAAGYRVHRGGAALFVFEHNAVEAVHDPFRAVLEAGGVVSQGRASAQRLHAVNLYRVVQEPGEHAHGVGAAAYTGYHGIGKLPGHLHKLLPGLNAHNGLEVPDHQGEGVGPHHGADAVNAVPVIRGIGGKGRIHRLFQGGKAFRYGNHVGSQNLHSCHVGSLLLNVHLPHVNVALQAKVGGGGSQSHAVLSGAGFGDDLFLSHVLGKEGFSHAVVQLVGAGVVQILPLGVKLDVPQGGGEALQVGDGGGSALKFLPNPPQLRNKLPGLADGVVGIRNLLHGGLQLRGYIDAAVGAEVALFVRVVLEIGVKICAVEIHSEPSVFS